MGYHEASRYRESSSNSSETPPSPVRKPGYHRRKREASSPLRTRVRVCKGRCAPCGVKAVDCSLKRFFRNSRALRSRNLFLQQLGLVPFHRSTKSAGEPLKRVHSSSPMWDFFCFCRLRTRATFPLKNRCAALQNAVPPKPYPHVQIPLPPPH